jgi:hypothetical protein
MYLKYKPTGKSLMIAKRLGWGWYPPDGLEGKLEAFLKECAEEFDGTGHHDDFELELEIPVTDNSPMRI